jgi:hypothetical protein
LLKIRHNIFSKVFIKKDNLGDVSFRFGGRFGMYFGNGGVLILENFYNELKIGIWMGK